MMLNFPMIIQKAKDFEKDPLSDIVYKELHGKIHTCDIKSEGELKSLLENMEWLVLKLSPDDLIGNGTICGDSGNSCFNSEIVEKIKHFGVDTIFCTFSYDEDNENYRISSAYLNFEDIDGEKEEFLSELIDSHGGSWRPDNGFDKGWTFFESE